MHQFLHRDQDFSDKAFVLILVSLVILGSLGAIALRVFTSMGCTTF